MSTVLITGGTGLVGKKLADALATKGYHVIILSRSLKDPGPGKNISYALWDIKKQYIDVAAIRAADHIIHLAGASIIDKRWTVAYKKEIRDSRTESSRLIIEALKNNENKVKAVVSAGALGWYGEDADPASVFIETDPAADNFAGQTCRLWEESIEPVTHIGKRLVKFRIGIVLSNAGGAYPEFKKTVRFGIAAILGSGKQIVSWIHIDDLCRLFIYALENEQVQGSYNAVAPVPVSNKALILEIAKKMKGNFYIPVHVPALILKTILGQRTSEVLKSATLSCKKITGTGFVFEYDTINVAVDGLEKTTGRL